MKWITQIVLFIITSICKEFYVETYFKGVSFEPELLSNRALWIKWTHSEENAFLKFKWKKYFKTKENISEVSYYKYFLLITANVFLFVCLILATDLFYFVKKMLGSSSLTFLKWYLLPENEALY